MEDKGREEFTKAFQIKYFSNRRNIFIMKLFGTFRSLSTIKSKLYITNAITKFSTKFYEYWDHANNKTICMIYYFVNERKI